MERLKDLLSGLDGLRADVSGTQALLAALTEDEPDAQAVERLVQKERAVGLSVLRLANSARFGAARSIADLGEAVRRIGFAELRQLVVAHQARQLLAGGGRAYGLDGEAAWRGAVAGAIAAELTAQRTAGVDPASAFSGGLYRDCGKLAVHSLPNGEALASSMADAADDEATLDLERDVIGYDHQEVGAVLAELWELPTHLVRVIRHHHEPSATPDDLLVACVHCGDVVATHMGYGAGLDGTRYRIDAGALERLGVDLQVLLDLLCETKARLAPYLEEGADGTDTHQEAA